MSIVLSPSQQAVFDAFLAAWEHHPLFHLWAYTGRGRSTILEALHARLGGTRITMRDFVHSQVGRDPIALEDTIYCTLRDALLNSDNVFVDDWQLVSDVVSGCTSYPRAGFLEAIGAALAELVVSGNKRLLIASQSGVPDAISIRCCPHGIGEFQVDDYRHLAFAFGGPAAEALDFAQIHRFAPRLNAYQLRDACRYLAREHGWTTEAFIEYLRERELASNVRLPEVAPVHFEDLIGVEDVTTSLLKHIVLPLENDALALEFDLKPKRGVLLLGPPGTGKTTIGKALAHRLKGKFFLIDGTVISGTDHFYHQVMSIFRAARDNAPSVIFIDDSDVIFENQQEHGLYRYLLTMLDGLEGHSNGRVCVMLTAMELQHIPPALMRSGRVELWLEMRYPDLPARRELWRLLAQSQPAEIAAFDVETVATATEGCSGADLKRLLNDAKSSYVWDRMQTGTPESFTPYLLDAARSFLRQRADYHVAGERTRKQRSNRPVWFDVPTTSSAGIVADG